MMLRALKETMRAYTRAARALSKFVPAMTIGSCTPS